MNFTFNLFFLFIGNNKYKVFAFKIIKNYLNIQNYKIWYLWVSCSKCDNINFLFYNLLNEFDVMKRKRGEICC